MSRKATSTPPKTGTTKTTRASKTKSVTVEENVGIVNTNNTNLLAQIKLTIKHKNENQKKLTDSIKNNVISICTGSPGTGKTYLSCLQALHELKNDDKIKKIVLVKSVTTLKSEEIGFLKGDMDQKMEPFMYSFTGNFEKIIGAELFEKLKTEKYIEIKPIAYLRGVNIDNAIVIIDEVQNISIDNIKTILTRLGENSKMIFLGDVKQIDAKNKYDSALSFLINYFKGIKEIGIVGFTKDDIVRHWLIKIIEEIFDKVEEEKQKELAKKETVRKEPVKKTTNSKFKMLLKYILNIN